MKVRVFVVFLVLIAPIAFAQAAGPAPTTPVSSSAVPDILQGPHYHVTSWAGKAAGEATLKLMEALCEQYNSLFLFDLSKVTSRWNVEIYPDKASFDAALKGTVPTPLTDYVFLHYRDPQQSRIVAWVPEKNSPLDEVRSLAFQGFYQFLWTFVPHPPAWIETGLANHFWNELWDGKTLKMDTDWPYLPTLKTLWADRGPDLEALLSAPEGSLDTASGKDLEAWGLIEYLLSSPDPANSRLLGSLLANLSPTAAEEANRDAALQRVKSAMDFAVLSAATRTWWMAKVSFGEWIQKGQKEMKDGDPISALRSYKAALELRPADGPTLYYAGLAAYNAKDYTAADQFYAQIDQQALPAGLLEYAKGVNEFALKKYDAAKADLMAAKTANAAAYGPLVAPVLELIR